MKALENDCTIYVEQIVLKTESCYAKSQIPSNIDLMQLYCFIGKSICQQGEKAFVVYLAKIISEKHPKLKGFSPRNLRRMRDFYKTYETQPELMAKVQSLSWTQNTLILECCKTNDQRSFYISLAKKNKLSKLALIKAIKEEAFELASTKEVSIGDESECNEFVGDIETSEDVDTDTSDKTDCRAFVLRCERISRILNQETSSQAILLVIKILPFENVLKWLRYIKNIKYK